MYFTLTWTMRFLGTFFLGIGSRKVKLDSGQSFSVVVVFLSVTALNETLSEWEMRCRHTFCLIHCASQSGNFAEVPELVDLASGPHCICAGPASAEEVERRFVFHRISVVYG